MTELFRRGLLAAGAVLLPSGGAAWAQGRAEALRYVTGGAVNTLDPVALGATAESGGLSTCTYDRLLRFGRVAAGPGAFVFDFERVEGELAEGVAVSADGLEIVLTLRPGSVWHDGSPVTVEDVRWSFVRAVSGGTTMGQAQLATGSLTEAAQMTVLDERRVLIALPRPDRLAVANLATVYAPMFNSGLARRHATEADPWATGWLRENTAGGGAYRVASFVPGQQVTLERNEGWGNGAMPQFRRAILQTVPEGATRAALLERGDADLTTGLPVELLRALAGSPAVRVVSTPMPTGFGGLVFNTAMPPFDRVAVRRALAMAVPYEAILGGVLDGRGTRLFGARWTVAAGPEAAGFPQALPLRTDLVGARAALADAGLAGGFETTLSYSVSRAGFGDGAAALIQESFAAVGVKVAIEKLSDARMAEAVTAKQLPMLLERSLALFPSTEYFFRVFLSGTSRWNLASWNDPEVAALLPQARAAVDPAERAALARRLVARVADQVPMALIWQPTLDVVTGKDLVGFTTWSNYLPDLRDLRRG